MYYVGVTCHIIQPGPFKTSIVDPGEMQFALQKSYDATDSEVRAFYGQQWLDKCEDSLSIYRFCLVCLFGFFSSHSRIFHSYGDVTITDERLQFVTYARHLWPLSSKGSLACHTYCDTDHSFITVISEDL